MGKTLDGDKNNVRFTPLPIPCRASMKAQKVGRRRDNFFCGEAVSDGLSILLFYYLLLVCNDVDAAN